MSIKYILFLDNLHDIFFPLKNNASAQKKKKKRKKKKKKKKKKEKEKRKKKSMSKKWAQDAIGPICL